MTRERQTAGFGEMAATMAQTVPLTGSGGTELRRRRLPVSGDPGDSRQ
jgi:hypothetical protein